MLANYLILWTFIVLWNTILIKASDFIHHRVFTIAALKTALRARSLRRHSIAGHLHSMCRLQEDILTK
jgi:hypothetical protein